MERAIELAWRGWGRVHPNPLVGAVVLDAAGAVVGEGFHGEFGGPHAERVEFHHPATQELVEIVAPIPADIAGLVAALNAAQ